MTPRTRVYRFLVLILLLALVIAACGDRTPEDGDPPPPPSPTSGADSEITPVIASETPAAIPVDTPTMAAPTDVPTPAIVLPAPLYFLSDGQIQRLETDGVTLTQLTQEQAPITDFDVSPIDARLVYVSDNDLIEANPQYGTRIVKVEGNPIDPDDPSSYASERISDPRFRPDGRQIAFGLGGVNLIDAGEVITYTTVLASDPYPNPNNPPRSDVRFFVPGEWSADGAYLMVRFSYWPEAGGLSVLDLRTNTLIDLSSTDPNTPVCCDWAWSRDGETAFIASNLFVYGTPGLAQVDVSSGMVTSIIQGMPLGQVSAENPMRFFRSPHQTSAEALLTFASTQTEITAPARYTMIRVEPESGALATLPVDAYETIGDILWARDGSGAALVLVTSAGPLDSLTGPILWVPVDGSPTLELPAFGEKLRWGPSATTPASTPTPETEEAAAGATESEGEDEGESEDEEAAAESGQATVTAQVLLNVRSGPSTAYTTVGELLAGESARITGVSPDGAWWQIVYPPESDTRAWVTGDPTLTSAENTGDVAVVTPPPLPRPVGRIFYSAPDPNGGLSIFAQSLAPGAVPERVLPNATQPSLYRNRARLAVRSTRSDLLGIGILDLPNGQITGVTSHLEDSLPAWNPSGDQLVFASTRHGDKRWRVYAVPASGNQTAQELTFGLDPDWHPSVDRIVYKGCDDRGEGCGLWTMDSSGSNRTPLTANKTDSRPVWSSDGRAVIFMSESRHGNWEIYTVDAGGNVLTRLTDDPALDGLPTISPDGSRVAFVSNRGGTWGIWVVPLAGGNTQQVITIGPDLPNWLEQGIDWAE